MRSWVILCTFFFMHPAVAETPRVVVENLHEALEQASAGDDQSYAARSAILAPVVESGHDLDYIARFTLRRQWRELSDEQKDAFVRAFSTLAINSYVSRFKDVPQGAFTFISEEAEGSGRFRVSTEIRPANGEPVSLVYVLRQRDDAWRIINVVADGVSDLALKRAEYQRLFTDLGFDGLVLEITNQAESLADSQ